MHKGNSEYVGGRGHRSAPCYDWTGERHGIQSDKIRLIRELSADEFTFADWDCQRVNPVISKCSVDKGSEFRLVTDDIISHQDATRYHRWNQWIVALLIQLLSSVAVGALPTSAVE